MYHPVLPLNTMVQLMNGQHINGPIPHSQNPTLFVNGVNSYYPSEHTLCNEASNYNRFRMLQGSLPISMFHRLMTLDMPPTMRRHSYGQHNNGGNSNGTWPRRSNGLSVPPAYRNFNNNNNSNNNGRPNGNNSMKKTPFNKNAKRTNVLRTGQENMPKELPGSDSGFSSRSPTPNKSQLDDNFTESSDDRDSVLSQTDQTNKRSQEVNHNINFLPSGLIPNVSAHQFYQNQQRPGNFYHSEVQTPRSSVQTYQNKRRFNNQGRSNSPQQRNQRNRKYMSPMPMPYLSVPRCPPMVEYFLARSHLTVQKTRPEYLLNGSIWDKLSENIWNKFIANQQTEQTFRNKMLLWGNLFFYIKTAFPRYNLFMVGSTMNGFGSDNSDVDMCLVVRNTELSPRTEAISHLVHLQKCLKRIDFIDQIDLIQAKVPILKFHDSMHNLEIDLNCNNAVGIRNTHLLYCYSRIDYRVRPLVLIVKLWAQSQDINDAKNMTISSYSLVLMVIHFLQCGANPSILPCLHLLYKGKFEPMSDIHQINLHEELDISTKPLPPLNRQSLGELLVQFFKYYSTFDFIQYAISVRLAKKIPVEECRQVRSLKNDPHQWKYLCIEEPFDQTNTARSVYDPEVFEKIKRIIKLSYERLNETRDLSSIFTKLVPDMSRSGT